LLSALFAPDGVKNALLHANKKTIKLIGFIRLHTENGGILRHRDVEHSEQWTVKQWAVKSE
jgi:hypothetical protein